VKARRPAVPALLAPALVLSTLASCWTPPFDPDLSVSELTAGKMERVASIGPVDYAGLRFLSCYFTPAYEERPTEGYWACLESGDRLEVRYVGSASGALSVGPSLVSQPNHWGGLNAAPAMPSSSASSLSPSLLKAYHVLGGGSVGLSSSEAMLGVGLNADLSPNRSSSAAVSGLSSEMTPIGGSARNLAAGGLSRQLLMSGYSGGVYALYLSDPALQPYAGAYAAPSIVGESLYYPGPPLAEGSFCLDYSDALSNPYHLVVGAPTAGGGVLGFRWAATSAGRASAPDPVHFDRRITDALHDDTLVARGTRVTAFFDVAGNPLFSLPTGALRYIHEYFDGTEWYSYFTRVVVRPSDRDDSKGTVRFDIYRYPTAGLAGLAE
jgi:hypothetical protein